MGGTMAQATATPGKSGGGSRSRPLTFAFDARAKPLLEQLLSAETRRRRRWFVRKPKVGLHEMEAALQQAVAPAELAGLLRRFIAFHYTAGEAQASFEGLGRLLLEAAARETRDGDRQRFLLFQAVEALSIAIQKSPKALNLSAQSVIVAIYKILGGAYYETAAAEREVHRLMGHMLNVKKDPSDLGLRETLIRLYLRGNRYYEALVQMAEFEKIMRVKSRPLYNQKAGELNFRKAQIFQSMIDFYYNVRAGKEESRQVMDMSKLQGFITRFNRDNRRYTITPLKRESILDLQKTVSSMIGIANHYYLEAIRSDKFAPKHKAYYFVARNHQLLENPKQAIQYLNEGKRSLDHIRLPAAQKAEERIKFLDFLYRLYSDRGLQKAADDALREIAVVRKEMQRSSRQATATPPPGEVKAQPAQPGA